MKSIALQRTLLGLLPAALGLLSASAAHAQTAVQSAAAQALFDRAKALMAAGKAAEACPKLEESERLDPSSGTLINLALCYEKIGRIASAWTTYGDAAVAARAAGNGEREQGARERASALEPQVSKVLVEVPPGTRTPGLVITRDGFAVSQAEWGVPIPADEGSHEVIAKAPGHQDRRWTVAVVGQGTTLTVSVPALAVAQSAPASRAASTPSPASSSSGLGGQRIGALVAGGVGVAGLTVGSIFGLSAMSKQAEAKKDCAGTSCTSSDGVRAGNDAHAAGNVATLGMIVGVVGLAGGAALWLTAPARARGAEVGLGFGSVALRGAF